MHVHTCADRLLEILDSTVLALIGVALLVMQPAELLKDLGVIRRLVQDALVCRLGAVKLPRC